MRTSRPKSLLERSPDVDLWRHTLSQIPTLTGRLVYLGTLRNPISGKYEHHGLALLFGDEAADRAIRQSHKKCFQDWLDIGLAEKLEDVTRYFESTGEDVPGLVAHWLRAQAWLSFLPASIVPAEKSIYTNDMRNTLKLLSTRFGDGGPDRNA